MFRAPGPLSPRNTVETCGTLCGEGVSKISPLCQSIPLPSGAWEDGSADERYALPLPLTLVPKKRNHPPSRENVWIPKNPKKSLGLFLLQRRFRK